MDGKSYYEKGERIMSEIETKETRGGVGTVSLNAKIWTALKKYVEDHPKETRGSVLRAALVDKLQNSGYLEKSE